MNKKLILITGGCGYIGSHTIIEFINNGFDVASIDNFSRSSSKSLKYIKQITGYDVLNYNINLTEKNEVTSIFNKLGSVFGVVHFAAFKSVPESINFPEIYYHNNIFSLVNILENCITHSIKNFVFSSSCSIYGDIDKLPVTELTILAKAKSPYAYSKVIGERIVEDICKSHGIKAMCLRYFNPVGAHTSGLIGEMPLLRPDNLVPVITQTAIGKRKFMEVFGGSLDTRDGSCVRDYVHVMDISTAHVLALQKLNDANYMYEIINLGSGRGVSVFEAIDSFEKVSGLKLNYKVVNSRVGDVIEIYSNIDKAKKILNWEPKYDINAMMSSAWLWENELYRKSKKKHY